ncbi:MAG: hypothetical protein AMK73_04485 [Planctomycetes bacterium SM23_32]|nr:MAG: hypothetical protein AMK73_04485 [Planctomycetes bacterium SM23_32]
MGKRAFVACLLAAGLLCALSASAEAALVWDIQTVDSGGSVGSYTSLALDSYGLPHISYRDSTNASLKYVHWDQESSSWAGLGGSWTVDSTGSVGYFSSLALDSSGSPHISYFDWATDYWDLKCVYWDGDSWEGLGGSWVVDSEGMVGYETSLALDSNGYPHISYNDATNDNLKCARWTGSSWDIGDVAGVGWALAGDTSLALDSSGHEHISYYDDADGDLSYAEWTGSSWVIRDVPDWTAGGYNSLALDSTGNVHIAYWGDGKVKHAVWNGSSWQIDVVDTIGAIGGTMSLALDDRDYPHIAYHYYAEDDLRYAYWDGSSWTVETVDSEGNVGLYASLGLDSYGFPHISYLDSTNSSLMYAMGTPEPATCVLGLLSLGFVGLYVRRRKRS